MSGQTSIISPQSAGRIAAWRRFAWSVAGVSMLAGGLVLMDWIFGLSGSSRLARGGFWMEAHCGLGFLMAGLALWLQLRPCAVPRITHLARTCALGVIVVGLANVVEYLLDWNLDLGQWLSRRAFEALAGSGQNSMDYYTATNFLVLGAALGLLVTKTERGRRASQWLALLAALLALLALIQSTYGSRMLSGAVADGTAALPSAILFLLLSAGALCVHPDYGLVAEITSEAPGGRMARRLLPCAIGAPLLVGCLIEILEREGWLGVSDDSAVFATLVMSIFAVLVWLNARALNRLEEERRQALETRLRLAAIVESSEDSIIGTDLAGTIVDWNHAAERLYGYSAAEALGQPLSLIVPAERRPEMDAVMERIKKGERVAHFETVRQPKNGPAILMEITVSPIADRMGRILGTASMGREITQRKRLETELRQSQERFERFFRSNPAPISIITLAEGRIVDINDSFAAMTGYARTDAIGRTALELGLWLEPERRADLARLMVQGPVRGFEFQFRTRTGVVRDAVVSTEQIDVDGLRCIIFISEDITQRKQAEREVARLHRQNSSILNAASEGILGLGANGEHIFVNPSAAAILGYGADELIGQPSHSLWHHTLPDGASYPEDACPVRATYRDGLARHVADELFWRKDGTSFPVEYTSAPIREGDQLVGAVVTFRDITDRRRAEAERERLIQELQEALANVKTLSGLLPICAHCKKIRDDGGYWNQIESYIQKYSGAQFSHGLCPDCIQSFYSA